MPDGVERLASRFALTSTKVDTWGGWDHARGGPSDGIHMSRPSPAESCHPQDRR